MSARDASSFPMSAADMALLNPWQHGFPLVREPFAHIAQALDLREADVLAACERLQREGAISRIGGVFAPGAGGAAHLPGMLAAKTIVPVMGVPVPSKYLRGEDSLLSIVQMPKGIPVHTFAIGEAGAANAALGAVAILALTNTELNQKLQDFRVSQSNVAREMELPPLR